MKCNHCGYKLLDPQQFCPECGEQITSKEKGKKGNKLIWILSGIFGFFLLSTIAIVVLYNVGKSTYDPSKLIANFEGAIESEDLKTVASLLKSDVEEFKITAHDASSLVQFLNENPNIFNELKSKLHNQLDSIQELDTNEPKRDSLYGEIYVRKAGKKWMVFDNYELAVIPAYIDITIKNGELDIFIDDEQVTTLNEDHLTETFGPFMPGTYTVKAVFENAYVTSDEETEIEVFESGIEYIPYTFEMEIEEILLSSKFQDYDLYLNGEKTDIPVSKSNREPIGKFPTNGKIVAQVGKDFPWGNVKSKEQVIDSQYLTFEVIHPLTHEEQMDLFVKLNDIMHSFLEALNEQDPALLSDYVSENIVDTLEDLIPKVYRRNSEYNGSMRSVKYNAEKIINPYYDELLEAYAIKIEAEYMFYEPNGTIRWLDFGSDDEKKEKKYLQELTVFYNEEKEQWMLDNMKTSYAFVFDSEAEIFEFND